MVLISVDLPQPFGPNMQTCSPAPMRSDTPSSAGRAEDSPRTTVTSCKARSGGGVGISDSINMRSILSEQAAKKRNQGIQWKYQFPVRQLNKRVDRRGVSSFGLAFDGLGLDRFSAYSQCIVAVALAMVCRLAM